MKRERSLVDIASCSSEPALFCIPTMSIFSTSVNRDCLNRFVFVFCAPLNQSSISGRSLLQLYVFIFWVAELHLY